MKNDLIPLLGIILLTTPLAATAQQFGDFTFTSTRFAITITGYTGPGGAVTIPDTINGRPVTTIGDNAFYGISSLTSVTIPGSVNYIGNGDFVSCSNLMEFTVDTANAIYSSLDGVLFTKSQTTILQYPNGKAGGYAIPGSVSIIGNGAFAQCAGLTGVSIPGSVTTIGSGAFTECFGLASVIIPNSVTNIGGYAFQGCSGLTNITVAAFNPNYSSVNGVLFDKPQTTLIEYPGGLGGSYTIPSSITNIGAGAFFVCSGLTSVVIPNSFTSIGDDAFEGFSGLTSVVIPNSVTNIGGYAFARCTGLTSVIIPNSATSIGDGAFSVCTSLTSVVIPNSVTNIGGYAFQGCSGLTSVIIPNSVIGIGSDAFLDCTGLTSVIIPSSVTNIRDYAFQGCSGLTSVTIPNSVTSFGLGAFTACTGLTSVTIPNSVTNIGGYAFQGCTGLTSAYFQGNAPTDYLGAAFIFDGLGLTVYYLSGTTGWGTTFGGRPAVLWNPVMQSSGVGPAGFGFNITGTADIPIVVEAATSLANAAWVPLQSLNLTNGAFYFSDPNWTNYNTRFYRIRSP